MKWHQVLRVIGIVAFLLGLWLYAVYELRYEIFLVFVVAVGTLVMPEFVDKSGLPWSK